MNQDSIRKMFPMLQNNITYLDNNALVQKPKQVINAILNYYTNFCISNRTINSEIGIIVDEKIKETKKLVADLLSCDEQEIIFNSGATDGLNYSALILKDLLKKDDEILIPKLNHSSHMIPWIEIAKERKAKVVFTDNLLNDINKKTKIIAYTQLFNSFNENNVDIKQLWKISRKYNSIIVNDAAQAISHEKVSANYADIIAFSANKFFGPTGLGILYISNKLLNKTNSKKFGGGAVDFIKKNGVWKPKDSIASHEPGTLNIAGIFGFNEAIKFWNSIDKKWMKKYIEDLSEYAYDELQSIPNINIVSERGNSTILFEVINRSSQDVASYLGHNNVYVRNGNFCAQYLKNVYEGDYIRVSIHLYNNVYDIKRFIKILKAGGDFLDFV